MPIAKAKNITGKTAEFYFIQAMKNLARNEIALAIEKFHKGLSIEPSHFLCRFNHGALMLKLGLIRQAKFDFEFLAEHYPKEVNVMYNLALTVFHLGEYRQAIKVSDRLILRQQAINSKQMGDGTKQSLTDAQREGYSLLHDTHVLRSQCFWRIKQPLEAVANFKLAKRFK